MMSAVERIAGNKRAEFKDFLKRYDQGPLDEGYTDSEVRSRYEEVAARLPDSDYEESAMAAFSRMTPGERNEFYSQLRSSATRQGFSTTAFESEGIAPQDDPAVLAGLTTRLRSEPEVLPSLLNDNLANSALKAGFAGIAANAINKVIH
jgi:hypothetical protein